VRRDKAAATGVSPLLGKVEQLGALELGRQKGMEMKIITGGEQG
jgi:hypothetical protein